VVEAVSWFDTAVPPGSVPREYLEIEELRVWARTQADAKAALQSVERADWLLFLALLAVGDEAALKKLVLATSACVRETLAHAPADPRPREALDAAEKWARGELDRSEPRAASAHAQAAAAQLGPAQQAICHACAACARAVLARERNPSWKAAIADQALRAPAQVLADASAPAVPDGAPMASYDARRKKVADERLAVLRRFAVRLRTALNES
jgi:hypothetical protein